MAQRPWGLEWRSSTWFVTFVVGLGVLVDLLAYSVIIPVVPFQLQAIGYDEVSVKTGWLVAAFSIGLIAATPPISYFAERSWNRRYPMIIGLIALVASQVMFMEAHSYWLLCTARVIQGVSSAVVWTVASALLCDTVPEDLVGQQFGLAMIGSSIGLTMGPPLGGVLFEKLGFRAPFILSIAFAVVDLIGRLLVIEKAEAVKWLEKDKQPEVSPPSTQGVGGTTNVPPLQMVASEERAQPLSVIQVVIALCKNRKAITAFIQTFCCGIAITAMEPTLPLRLQEVYGYTSLQVGFIFMVADVPTLFALPLSGWLSGRARGGPEWTSFLSLLLSIPWWMVMTIRGSIALFATSLALSMFFLLGVLPPLTAGLAAAAREVPGLGYAHVFGAFNFAYSLSSAVGPIIGSQLFQHATHGWTVIMCLTTGLIVLAAILSFVGGGSDPLARQLWRACRGTTTSNGSATTEKQEGCENKTPV